MGTKLRWLIPICLVFVLNVVMSGTIESAQEATQTPSSPLSTSTPASDGSIVHIVEPGQSLWTIALMYSILESDLKRLNGIPESSNLIFPGDRLIIREAVAGGEETPGTPEATWTPTPTNTPEPVHTRVYAGATVRVRIANIESGRQTDALVQAPGLPPAEDDNRFWYISGIALVALVSVILLSRKK